MDELSAQQFAVRFKKMLAQKDGGRFTFFLGAGCSISSGIPGAGELVQRWMPQLHQEDTDGKKSFGDWLRKEYPEYKPEEAGRYYATVMRRLFPQQVERQREIERIVRGKDPGFGYAVLAQLISNPDWGSDCNLILTTNFDDMVADALYLYTQHKPMVIIHESLAGFAETGLNRPLVVKLHGDALLAPKNTREEIYELPASLRDALKTLLSKRGLVFIGYGGNDQGVRRFLEKLPRGTFNWGVFWVNDAIPQNDFGKWLKSRSNAFWVRHRDFDELMLLLRAKFNLGHPEWRRFQDLKKAYSVTFRRLEEGVAAKPESPAKKALTTAVEKATEGFTDWWPVEETARKYKASDADRADATYREGLERFPRSYELMFNYANFLRSVRKNYDEAEEQYKKALAVAPNHPVLLGGYAMFLRRIKGEHDEAELYYRQALEADPTNSTNNASYALFLQHIRKDLDQAEIHYQRALEADPNDAVHLGNYAGLLLSRGRGNKGLPYLQKALSLADSATEDPLILECQFYRLANGPDKERTEALTEVYKLLTAGTRSPGWDFSQNIERAEKEGHPNVPLLKALAAVIADGAEISTLDQFEEWRNAA